MIFFNLQNSNIKHKWKCSNMMENKNYFSARSPFWVVAMNNKRSSIKNKRGLYYILSVRVIKY